MSSKKQQPAQLEGPGRHSGRPHPKAEKAVDAKEDKQCQKRALKDRQATQDHE